MAPGGRCAFRFDDGPPVELPALRAFTGYRGRRDNLSAVELSRWRERLDHEAGLLDQRPLVLELPGSAPESARVVAEAIGRLTGLRDSRWRGEPFVFVGWGKDKNGGKVIGFGAAYAGVNPETVYDGLRQLKKLGVIEHAGKSGSARLWRLRAAVDRPLVAGKVEARRPDLHREGRPTVRDGHLSRGQEIVGAEQPTLEGVQEPEVLHTELLPVVEPSLSGLGATARRAPVCADTIERPPERGDVIHISNTNEQPGGCKT